MNIDAHIDGYSTPGDVYTNTKTERDMNTHSFSYFQKCFFFNFLEIVS